jgi:hypothetical protein
MASLITIDPVAPVSKAAYVDFTGWIEVVMAGRPKFTPWVEVAPDVLVTTMFHIL